MSSYTRSTGICCLIHCAFAPATFFFFNDPATTEIYTLSLHDALPISPDREGPGRRARGHAHGLPPRRKSDRKSTRLNSSHVEISYAVFCLKKKKTRTNGPVAGSGGRRFTACHPPRTCGGDSRSWSPRP